ncbi:MAG: phosphatidate cytidylyltransferase [Gemmatimonadetes bacterium]|nr:phosphatidate cytidylyltransferase [Gemmatimonadota bacterium]
MTELSKRIAFAVVAIPVVAGVVWAGGVPLAVLLALVSALAAREFYRLATAGGIEPLLIHGLVLSALIPIGVHSRYAGSWVPSISVVMLVVLELLAAALLLRGATRKPLEAVGITILGVLYSGGMLGFAVALRYHRFALDATSGALLVAFPLALTWGTDTGAMLLGRAWGKTKLMPSISPGKTLVGAWGGAAVAVLISVLYVRFGLAPYAHLTMSVASAAAFGLIVSAAGQVGDLVESMLKRQAGVKDSSALIPGHGGALDRVDSLLFTLPVSFVLLGLLLAPTP